MTVKGPPKFIVIKINPIIEITGEIDNKPLFKIDLRLCLFSYNELAKENSPDDVNPWETIISNPPSKPNFDLLRNMTLNILM